MPNQVALIDKSSQVHFGRIPVDIEKCHDIRDRELPSFLGKHKYPLSNGRELFQTLLLFHFVKKDVLLLLQCEEKEADPVIQVFLVGPDMFLPGAERPVIGIFVLFNDALKGTIGDIIVSGLEKQQGSNDAREAAVTILEWMNGQKLDNKNADHQDGV